jgi:hypothetical protein
MILLSKMLGYFFDVLSFVLGCIARTSWRILVMIKIVALITMAAVI